MAQGMVNLLGHPISLFRLELDLYLTKGAACETGAAHSCVAYGHLFLSWDLVSPISCSLSCFVILGLFVYIPLLFSNRWYKIVNIVTTRSIPLYS